VRSRWCRRAVVVGGRHVRNSFGSLVLLLTCLSLLAGVAMASSTGSDAQSASTSAPDSAPAPDGSIKPVSAEQDAAGPAPTKVTRVCEARESPNVRRLLANPKALRLGRLVFTPLALLGSVQPQPYSVRGAPRAAATKLGAALFGGAGRARITIAPRGAARLVYGDELNQKLSSGDVAWSALPRSVVLIACTDERGRARPTVFPGGFVFRNDRVCRIRLSVSSGGARVTRSLGVGFPACDYN